MATIGDPKRGVGCHGGGDVGDQGPGEVCARDASRGSGHGVVSGVWGRGRVWSPRGVDGDHWRPETWLGCHGGSGPGVRGRGGVRARDASRGSGSGVVAGVRVRGRVWSSRGVEGDHWRPETWRGCKWRSPLGDPARPGAGSLGQEARGRRHGAGAGAGGRGRRSGQGGERGTTPRGQRRSRRSPRSAAVCSVNSGAVSFRGAFSIAAGAAVASSFVSSMPGNRRALTSTRDSREPANRL